MLNPAVEGVAENPTALAIAPLVERYPDVT
jgi:hypothetical protein